MLEAHEERTPPRGTYTKEGNDYLHNVILKRFALKLAEERTFDTLYEALKSTLSDKQIEKMEYSYDEDAGQAQHSFQQLKPQPTYVELQRVVPPSEDAAHEEHSPLPANAVAQEEARKSEMNIAHLCQEYGWYLHIIRCHTLDKKTIRLQHHLHTPHGYDEDLDDEQLLDAYHIRSFYDEPYQITA